MLQRGDIVWGKLKYYPWWPAIIINPKDCGRDGVGTNKFWIFWFGDHRVNKVECNKVLDFQAHFAEKILKKGKAFKVAVHEALTVLASRYKIECSDPFTLFEWAEKGFMTELQLPSDNSNLHELPGVVINALKGKHFQRKYESILEEDKEDEIVQLLDDISKGIKDIEDICVMCCKSENVVIQQHPLFLGGVCQQCKKYIQKIMKFPRGQMNIVCVLCGQGGNLVYCNNNSCRSSYCEICIDYMSPKESFLKIVNDNKWKCNLCVPNKSFDSFIQRREAHSSMPLTLPAIPVEKLPIRVMGHSDAALSILEGKNIYVDIYAIESSKYLEPSSSKQRNNYADFTMAEMNEVEPDLIYGSFFVSPTALDDQKKTRNSLTASFYKFTYRLFNARLIKPSPFFMYMASGEILDADIMSRVMKFLQVNPFKIQRGTMDVYIWTNVPIDEKRIKQRKAKKGMEDCTSVEKDILKEVLQPLKFYFKQG